MGRLPIKVILGYTSWDYEGINVRVQKDTATTKGSKNIINIGNILYNLHWPISLSIYEDKWGRWLKKNLIIIKKIIKMAEIFV